MFTVIQDSREKIPWRLYWYNRCDGQNIGTLETGDYTVVGYEDQICIERKASTGELSTNLGSESKRFRAELERMSKFPHKFIICEFPLLYFDIFPKKSEIPYKLWKKLRMTGKFIKKRLFEWASEFDIKIVFAQDRFLAQTAAVNIITNILENKEYHYGFAENDEYEIYTGD